MHNSPEVSVILPFYNAEETLNRAIDSIAQQSLINFECILIDNNSTDNSTKIAKRWIKKDSRFKLVFENRMGVVFASNTGSKVAKGKFIARMDADDYSHSKRLELQSQFLKANKTYGAVCSLVKYIKHGVNTDGFKIYVDWVNSVRDFNKIFLKRFIESPIVNPSAMWRKSTSNNYGMYQSGNFPEDYEMWLRWLDKGVKIAKLNEYLLDWHDSEKRLTRTHEAYSDLAFFDIKSKYLVSELQKINRFHPKVIVWGASKTSRKRSALLANYGIEIESYIDVKRTRKLDRDVIYYEDLPKPGKSFVLVYMKVLHLRTRIQDYLEQAGYREGKDYLLLA